MILLPFEAPFRPLLLLRLPERGIFQVDGDGDGNTSAIEKERLGTASISMLASGIGLSVEGDTEVLNPTDVVGLF